MLDTAQTSSKMLELLFKSPQSPSSDGARTKIVLANRDPSEWLDPS